MKTYYSDWLRELEWLLTSLCNAAEMYKGCPQTDNHIIWKKNIDNKIHCVEKAMSEKTQSNNMKIFKLRLNHIKKLNANLEKSGLPWYLTEEMNFFNKSFNDFMSSCSKL